MTTIFPQLYGRERDYALHYWRYMLDWEQQLPSSPFIPAKRRAQLRTIVVSYMQSQKDMKGPAQVIPFARKGAS